VAGTSRTALRKRQAGRTVAEVTAGRAAQAATRSNRSKAAGSAGGEARGGESAAEPVPGKRQSVWRSSRRQAAGVLKTR